MTIGTRTRTAAAGASLALLVVIPTTVVAQTSIPQALGEIVSADRDFSRASELQGIDNAFLAYLADDAITFNPGPVDGKSEYKDHKSTGFLKWQPDSADVSRATDLGYTTGSWEMREATGDDPVKVWGDYVTIWRKQPDGTWRVAVDIGVSHPPPDRPAAGIALPPPLDPAKRRLPPPSVDPAATRTALLAEEESLSKASTTEGAAAAIAAVAADEIRIYRRSAMPVLGKGAVREALARTGEHSAWKPAAAGVASSGDFGYTYGSMELRGKPADKEPRAAGSYLRIWRKSEDGKWKVAVEVFSSAPGPAATNQVVPSSSEKR